MAYEKGERAKTSTGDPEQGIWHLADGSGYLVDIRVTDPGTGKRIRLRKTSHRVDLAREWRNKQQGDALTGEIKGRSQKKIPFKVFADEYFEAWKEERKESDSENHSVRLSDVFFHLNLKHF